MSPVPDSRTARPSRQEWDARRDTIIDLYIAQRTRLKDIMAMMRTLDFNPSEQQYKIKFREWGISKNHRAGSQVTVPRQEAPSHGTAAQVALPAQPFTEAGRMPLGHTGGLDLTGNVSGGDLSGSDLPDGNVSGDELPGGGFPGGGLPDGNVSGGDLSGSDLPNGNLSGGDPPGGGLPSGGLPDIELFGSDLPDGNVSGSNFPGFDYHLSQYSSLQPMNFGTLTSTKLRQPIHQAAQSGNLKMVELLLKYDATCAGLRGTDGVTALGLAAQEGHLEIVRLLLKYLVYGGDINVETVDGLRKPIHQAAQEGHVDVVRLLLESGADHDPHDYDEVTPLWVAAHRGHSEIVQMLINKGASIETASKDRKRRPLHQAAQEGHISVAHALLEAGASVEPSKGSFDDETPSPLFLAATKGDREFATLLIRRGADVNFRLQPSRRCPLHQAAQSGYADMVALLIENKADVDAREVDGWTPLMIAAQNNHVKTFDLLLRKGANVNAEEKDGATALWVASQQGHVEVVKTLLARDAKSIATYQEKRRPIHQAAQQGHLEVVKLLLDKFPNEVDVGEKDGFTPLFLASQLDKPGNYAVAEYLLIKGANVRLE